MKIQIDEYEGCFGITITAETLGDAAMLSRLGLNGLKEVRSLDTEVLCKGSNGQDASHFCAAIVIAKSAKLTALISRR